MAIDEAARHELYTRLDELLGTGPTSTLMSLLPPVGWADVATKDDLRSLENGLRAEIADLRTESRTGIADVRTAMAQLETGLRTEIADLRTETRTGLADVRAAMLDVETSLRTEIADMRTETRTGLADVRTEMHDSMRRLTLALVGAMVSLSGVTFAANALL